MTALEQGLQIRKQVCAEFGVSLRKAFWTITDDDFRERVAGELRQRIYSLSLSERDFLKVMSASS